MTTGRAKQRLFVARFSRHPSQEACLYASQHPSIKQSYSSHLLLLLLLYTTIRVRTANRDLAQRISKTKRQAPNEKRCSCSKQRRRRTRIRALGPFSAPFPSPVFYCTSLACALPNLLYRVPRFLFPTDLLYYQLRSPASDSAVLALFVPGFFFPSGLPSLRIPPSLSVRRCVRSLHQISLSLSSFFPIQVSAKSFCARSAPHTLGAAFPANFLCLPFLALLLSSFYFRYLQSTSFYFQDYY